MQTCPRCGAPVGSWPCARCGQQSPDAAPDSTVVAPWAVNPGDTRIAPDAAPGGGLGETRIAPDAHVQRAPGFYDDPPAPWETDGLYRTQPGRSAPSASEPADWGGQPGWTPGAHAEHPFAEQPYGAGGVPGYPPGQGYGYQGEVQDPNAYRGYAGYAPTPPRSRVPVIVGSLLAVAAVVVAGVLVVPPLLGGAGGTATPTAPAASTPGKGGVTRTVQAPATAAAPATTSTVGAAPAAQGQSGYFTFLDSLPKRHFSLNQARSMANRMSTDLGRPLVLLDSGATTGMSSPDYWIVGTGLSADLPTALNVCGTVGRKLTPEGDCYAKLLTYSAASVQTGGDVPETPQQECQQRGAPDVATCTAAYTFLIDYANAEKTLTRATVGDWYTEPADYYGITQAGLAKILASVTTPAADAPNVYLGGHLSAFDNSPGTPIVRILVPYRQKSDGELGLVLTQYLLRPGGPHGFRIAAVAERDATKG